MKCMPLGRVNSVTFFSNSFRFCAEARRGARKSKKLNFIPIFRVTRAVRRAHVVRDLGSAPHTLNRPRKSAARPVIKKRRIENVTLPKGALLLLTSTLLTPAVPGASVADQREFFEMRVRPVLAKNCFACHTGSRMGGLEMTGRERILKGGKSGPAIVPGDPEKSLLVQAVAQTHERSEDAAAGQTHRQRKSPTCAPGSRTARSGRNRAAGAAKVARPTSSRRSSALTGLSSRCASRSRPR